MIGCAPRCNTRMLPRPVTATEATWMKFHGPAGTPAALLAGVGHSTSLYGRMGTSAAAPPRPPWLPRAWWPIVAARTQTASKLTRQVCIPGTLLSLRSPGSSVSFATPKVWALAGVGVPSASESVVDVRPKKGKAGMETRRAFLGSLGVGLLGSRLAGVQLPAGGQAAASVPVRKVKTTPLFKSPEGYPNAIAVSPEGLWIGEQKSDNACLVDWKGKLLKTVKTESKNTSGMAVGGGYIWMGANAAPNGIFQTDMSSKTISHRQIPLGGGGCHGVEYVDGKLWIAALRLRGILRVDSKTWQPEFLIPYNVPR